MSNTLNGILPAIASPCTEKDVFLEDAYTRLATHLYREGVDGLYVCGFTGDCFNMRLRERKRAAELAVAVSRKHRGSVVVHVGSSCSRDSMELARHAAEAGADAVSCMPPSNRNLDQLVQYYRDVAGAAGIPVLIYHIPALTNQNLPLDGLLRLLDIPGVTGLKFSDNNLFLLRRLLLARPDIAIFGGNDEILCLAEMYGACGGIGMTYNLFPRLFVKIHQAVAAGELDRALRLQHAYLPFLDAAFKYGMFQVFNHIMRERGFGPFSFRRPRQVLDQAAGARLMDEVAPILAAMDPVKAPENNDHFPLQEYEDRLARLRRRMRSDGLDGLLLTTEANIVYATGFLNGYWICQNHDDAQFALIPADPDQEPVLLLPCHLEQTARTSCVSEIRVWSQFDAARGRGAVATVAGAVASSGLARGRIGMEIGRDDRPGLSPPFLRAIQEALPGVEWAEASGTLGRVRAIKSAREIEKVRTACRITCQAFQVGMDAIREGMSEKELGQVIALEMARQAPEACSLRPWFLFIHGTGRGPSAYDGMPTGYRFRRGDSVYVDGGFNFQGYTADMIRCASIGPPSAETERYYRANRDANLAAVGAMRPGISCRQVYERFAEVVRELGFGPQLDCQHQANWRFLGHGWGLSVHEAPFLDGVTEDVLEPGMVFSVEGNIFDRMPMPLTTQVLKNEENVLITATGHELLTPLASDLWIART